MTPAQIIEACVLVADLMAEAEDRDGVGNADLRLYALAHFVQDVAQETTA